MELEEALVYWIGSVSKEIRIWIKVDEVNSAPNWELPRSLSLWHNQGLVTIQIASMDHALDLVAAIQESKEHLAPHFDWISLPQTYATQRARLQALEQAPRPYGAYNFHLFQKSNLIGAFSLHHRLRGAGLDWEIGYWIHPDHLRQGFGTLALCGALWLQREFLPGHAYLQVHTQNQRGLDFLAKNHLWPEHKTTRVTLQGVGEDVMVFRPGIDKEPNFETSPVAYMIEAWKLKLIEVEW